MFYKLAWAIRICQDGFGYTETNTCYCIDENGQPTGFESHYLGKYNQQCKKCEMYSFCFRGNSTSTPDNANSCLPCCPNSFAIVTVDFYSSYGNGCQSCSPGTWSTIIAGQGATSCSICAIQPCPVGTYQPACDARQSECVPCSNTVPANANYSSSGGSDGVCEWQCKPGFFLEPASTICHTCSDEPCPLGLVRSQCTPAADGVCYYAGWVIVNGTKLCPPGTSGPDNIGPCVNCQANTYKNQPGPAACTPCPPNSVTVPESAASPGGSSTAGCTCLAGYIGAESFANRGPCAALGQCVAMTAAGLGAATYATAVPDVFITLTGVGLAAQITLFDAATGAASGLPPAMAATLDRWSEQNPLVTFTPVAYALPIFQYPEAPGGGGGWTWLVGVVTGAYAGVVALDGSGAYAQLAGGAVAPAGGALDGAGGAATFENPTVLAVSPDGAAAFMDDGGAVRRLDVGAEGLVTTLVSVAAIKDYFGALGSGSGSYGFYGCAAAAPSRGSDAERPDPVWDEKTRRIRRENPFSSPILRKVPILKGPIPRKGPIRGGPAPPAGPCTGPPWASRPLGCDPVREHGRCVVRSLRVFQAAGGRSAPAGEPREDLGHRVRVGSPLRGR